MESGDIGSGGADLGSVPNRHCSEYDATSIICRCSHSLHRTGSDLKHKGRPRGKRAFASHTMAMLNTIYDTPTCDPVDGGPRDYPLITRPGRAGPRARRGVPPALWSPLRPHRRLATQRIGAHTNLRSLPGSDGAGPRPVAALSLRSAPPPPSPPRRHVLAGNREGGSGSAGARADHAAGIRTVAPPWPRPDLRVTVTGAGGAVSGSARSSP